MSAQWFWFWDVGSTDTLRVWEVWLGVSKAVVELSDDLRIPPGVQHSLMIGCVLGVLSVKWVRRAR